MTAIRTPAQQLGARGALIPRVSANRRGSGALANLPFVKVGRQRRGHRPNYWAIPSAGGYEGGYQTGVAAGLMLLKALRDEDVSDGDPAMGLQCIAHSMMEQFCALDGAEMAGRPVTQWSAEFDSFAGQSAGFFNTLAQWLRAAAKAQGSQLDALTMTEMVGHANGGLLRGTTSGGGQS